MSTLFTGAGPPLVDLTATVLLFPFFIYLSSLIPYGLGKWLNSLFISGRSFNSSYQLCMFLGGMGFCALFILVLGASFLQLFAESAAEWWYHHFFLIGAAGNTIGITCFFLAGFFKGEFD